MCDARSGKQQISRTKRLSCLTTNVFTGAGYHKINFVARMRFLRIDSARCVNFNEQAAMLKHGRKALTVWTRQTQKRVFYGGLMTGIVWFHCLTSQGGGSLGCLSSYCLISSAKTA